MSRVAALACHTCLHRPSADTYLVCERERSPVNANRLSGSQVLVDENSLFGVAMLTTHEISANKQWLRDRDGLRAYVTTVHVIFCNVFQIFQKTVLLYNL